MCKEDWIKSGDGIGTGSETTWVWTSGRGPASLSCCAWGPLLLWPVIGVARGWLMMTTGTWGPHLVLVELRMATARVAGLDADWSMSRDRARPSAGVWLWQLLAARFSWFFSSDFRSFTSSFNAMFSFSTLTYSSVKTLAILRTASLDIMLRTVFN